MTEASLTLVNLSGRLAVVETSLRRTRLALVTAVLLVGALASAAWRSPAAVEAERLLLTDDVGTPVIVLRGVLGTPTPSLILETPGGVQVLALGPAARPVR